MGETRDARWTRRLLWAPSLAAAAVFLWTIACGQDSPSGPSGPDTVLSGGDFAAGVTSSRGEGTVPPPPPPPLGDKNSGILLAYDKECPTCTLVTPRGTALVWYNTELWGELQDGEVVPISFDQLNGFLMLGQPFNIRVDNLEARNPVAQILTVQRRFHTTGIADRSSDVVTSTTELVLNVTDENAGAVDIAYVLAPDGVVEPFAAGDRIFVRGVSHEGKLRVKIARPDE